MKVPSIGRPTVVSGIVRNGNVLWAAGDIGSRSVIWASRDDGHTWSPVVDQRGLFDGSPCADCQAATSIAALAVHNGVVVAVGTDFWAAAWRGAPG